VRVAADPEALLGERLDVYSPCALGDALTDDVVARLVVGGAQVVCGAANNQLAHPGVEQQLADRRILYAPDYVVNSGGLIQVADELDGFDFERAEGRASRIFETTREVFEVAAADGVPPAVAADRIAERRMAEAPGADRIWLPTDEVRQA
jgi:valine dehydrogenase (NAD+)